MECGPDAKNSRIVETFAYVIVLAGAEPITDKIYGHIHCTIGGRINTVQDAY